jgi:hypothetical protein
MKFGVINLAGGILLGAAIVVGVQYALRKVSGNPRALATPVTSSPVPSHATMAPTVVSNQGTAMLLPARDSAQPNSAPPQNLYRCAQLARALADSAAGATMPDIRKEADELDAAVASSNASEFQTDNTAGNLGANSNPRVREKMLLAAYAHCGRENTWAHENAAMNQ